MEVILMWLLTRRQNIAAAIAIWAVVVYATHVWLFLGDLDLYFINDVLSGRIRFQRGMIDDRIVPLKELLVVGSYLPLSFAAYASWMAMRRRHRANHDRCVMCGHPIIEWHGRCPGCGERIGPDPAVKVHVLRG
jgi:hypothetical protein